MRIEMDFPDVTLAPPPGCEPGGQWQSIPGFSKYEVWSAGGQGRDQRPVRNKATGTLLAVSVGTQSRHRPNAPRPGYLQTKLYNDQGKQETKTLHSLIMLGNVGAPEPGQQVRHLGDDPWDNRCALGGTEEEIREAGGKLIYGYPVDDHKDQVKAGTATLPQFPCVTGCGGTAPFEGARCEPCRTEAGIQAAALLSEGMALTAVTRKLGYTSERTMYDLACRYGGYTGTLAQARAGRSRPPSRRLFARLRQGSSGTPEDVALVAQFAETYADGPVRDAARRLLANDSK